MGAAVGVGGAIVGPPAHVPHSCGQAATCFAELQCTFADTCMAANAVAMLTQYLLGGSLHAGSVGGAVLVKAERLPMPLQPENVTPWVLALHLAQ